jgi:hypothetical protein
MPSGLKPKAFEDCYTIEPNSGCWLWLNALNGHGYGTRWHNNKQTGAHRVSYELHIGPVPEGLYLDHLCRVRCCVNPHHLEPVTQRENTLRGARGRMKTHCPHGHPLDYTEKSGKRVGRRRCGTCCKQYQARKRAGKALGVQLVVSERK